MVTVEKMLCGRQAPEDALRVLPFIYSAILACTPEKDVVFMELRVYALLLLLK